MTLRIDPATPADVPVVLSLIRALAAYEKILDQVTITEPELCEHLFGQQPIAQAMIARIADKPVGYAITCSKYSSFTGPGLFLEDIFVLPEHRGAGIGKILLREVARAARDRGFARLEWTVLHWNEPAIGFYKRLGAEVLPDWHICRMSPDAIARLADSV